MFIGKDNMPEEHFRKLENMYHAAPCNIYYQPKLVIARGAATIKVEIKPEYFHAAGAVHGALYFKIIDDAGYFAANSLVEDVFLLTSNINVHLIRPVQSGFMQAEATVVSETKNQIIADVVIKDAKCKQIGRGTGLYVRGKTALNPDIGYDINQHNLIGGYRKKFSRALKTTGNIL